MQRSIYFSTIVLFAGVFFSSCSFGKFVKIFHIKGQHKIPTYQFSSPPKELKTEFQKLFETHPELVLKHGQTNNYVDGTYFASVNDTVSQKKFAVRFGFYDEDSTKNISSSVIKIFSIKYDGETEWKAFFSHKIKRKEMKRIDRMIKENIFSKMPGQKFILIGK